MKSIAASAAALAAVTAFTFASSAIAEEAPPCTSEINRTNLVRCAVRASLIVRAQGDELVAARSREVSVSPVLPSNPVLAISAGRRTVTAGPSAFNWSATLSQEVEVAGQRGVRRDAAEADVDAQSKRVQLSKREVAAAAWISYFDALAAREQQRLALSMTEATRAVSMVANAKADKGLIAPVDADVADAATVRVLQAKLASDRAVRASDAALASMLGLDPAKAVTVEGDLVPLPGIDSKARSPGALASGGRPELLVLDAERRAFELRADAFRRARVPNPTVSVFAQNDGFDEKVFGVGLAFPIPLPGNVGRTFIGEISESEAFAHRAATDRMRVEREIRLERVTALEEFDSRRVEVEAFTSERLKRAEESLRAIGQEVEAGRLGVRDAVLTQQVLIELLQANVAARRAWCVASVELARAVGWPLEGAAQ